MAQPVVGNERRTRWRRKVPHAGEGRPRRRAIHLEAIAGLILYLVFIPAAAVFGRSATAAPQAAPNLSVFANPQRVAILGYDQDAMEPFITRDGKYLFFNNSNSPHVDTNLYWAQRIDDVTFQFEGEIGGINTKSLEAVASMDVQNNLFFVSPRSYPQTLSTVYWGTYSDGDVSGVSLVPGISLSKPGIVDFDAEISADGNTLYFSEVCSAPVAFR